MIIKRLDPEDAILGTKAVKLYKDMVVKTENMKRFLENKGTYLVVAEDEEEPVGFLLAYVLPRIDRNSAKLFIYELEVAAEHRRKGIGTALINFVRKIVKEEKFMNAFVFTSYSNKEAVEFYKHTGGHIVNGDDLMFVYTA